MVVYALSTPFNSYRFSQQHLYSRSGICILQVFYKRLNSTTSLSTLQTFKFRGIDTELQPTLSKSLSNSMGTWFTSTSSFHWVNKLFVNGRESESPQLCCISRLKRRFMFSWRLLLYIFFECWESKQHMKSITGVCQVILRSFKPLCIISRRPMSWKFLWRPI